jgi:hypothetical protein
VYLARQRFDVALFNQGFANLVRQHESGLVLYIYVAGKLQG